ncbi:FadR/GntR family transcriptional regulator [Litoreibacter albidus]|uniref:FadR/GntR family transcriptional regulator n=1 Tax=Litoreibacter albidus TaxID=670155 RepID=UPI000B7F71A8|nr:FadR/GntR family transcriptional regulator [Litoreibacter albidus]
MVDHARLPGSKTLVVQVGDALRQSIQSGEFSPGDKLPSEAMLTKKYDVSRTVVREAIASLRSDGLVEARQGAGVFVLNSHSLLRAAGPLDKKQIAGDLEYLEVRAPIEIEAARLAAQRRSPAQEEEIFRLHGVFRNLIETAPSAEVRRADLDLHLAIADATNNPVFRNFLEAFGRGAIPQSKIVDGSAQEQLIAYRRFIFDEHERILHAIAMGDAEGAENAMRVHLKGGQMRYRELLIGKRLSEAGTGNT